MDLRSKLRKRAVRTAFVFAAAAAAFLCGGLYALRMPSREALVYDAVCRALSANTTVGRQALVSSMWWPPLQALVRMPFALLLRPTELPLASLCASACFAAACLLLLDRVLRNWGLGRGRFLFLAAAGLNPAFLRAGFSGDSGAVALFFMLLGAYALVEWVTRRRLRSLVYFAFAVAMLPIASFDAALWGAVALLLLLGDLAVRPFQPREREAVLVMALTPLVYVLGLWMLTNWLIMGDGLYFMRSLTREGPAVDVHGAPAGMRAVYWLAAGLCLCLSGVAMATKRRGAVYLGLLGALAPALAYVLNARGIFWDGSPLLSALPLLTTLAFARIAAVNEAFSLKGRLVTAIAPLLVTAIMLATPAEPAGARRDADPRDADVAAQIARRVRTRSPFVKVYVCGYDGFLLSAAPGDETFVQTLDFNLNKAMEDYRGHLLFLLVHRPAGRSAMDSIHWKYDAIYNFGDRDTLYEDDFGPWRFYEIVQPR